MKKIITVLICFLLLISLTPVICAAEIPQTLEVPSSVTARYDIYQGMMIRWIEPESITKLYSPGPDKVLDNCFFEIDVKVNDGPWRQEGKAWGQNAGAGCGFQYCRC